MKYLLIILLLLSVIDCYSQKKEADKRRPCPISLVVHTVGTALEGRFNIVFADLPKFVHYKSIPLKCDKAEMIRLIKLIKTDSSINALRVYLAQDKDDSLKFIFVGLTDTTETKFYYIYNSTVSQFEAINQDEASQMVDSFQKKTLQFFSNGHADGNTKFYTFGDNALNEIDTEFSLQMQYSDIKYVGLKLGAFLCDSHFPCRDNDFRNRLMITFSFFRSNDRERYIEEINNSFGCDAKKTERHTDKIITPYLMTGGLDTGTPCPPNSCEGATLPKP